MNNQNQIDQLSIYNYKTIRSLSVRPKRINLLVGKPNVGKSNFLEALSLLGAGYSKSQIFLKDLLRFTSFADLFCFKDIKNNILVESNIGFAELRYRRNSNFNYELIIHKDKNILKAFDQNNEFKSPMEIQNIVMGPIEEIPNFKPLSSNFYKYFSETGGLNNLNIQYDSKVKKYAFNKELVSEGKYDNSFLSYLFPPFGDNLFSIINTSSKIRQRVGAYFKEYNLDFLLDEFSKKFEIQRRENDIIFRIPYSLIADTLQRLIFLISAIESNENNILLFEEPEAHSFPPYVNEIAEIINQSESNQFFISTHSPYLVQRLLKYNDASSLSLMIFDYKNHETIVKEVSAEKYNDVIDLGESFFFNLEKF